jgi:hypothetical protein
MNRGWQKRAVLEYLAQHPHARNVDIAEALGVRPAYVSTVRQKAGLARSRGPANFLGTVNIGARISQQPGLADWLKRECPEGVDIRDFVVAILVDAMNEDAP